MYQLVALIMSFLAANFGLAADGEAPNISWLDSTELLEIRYERADPSVFGDIVALYDDSTSTILLSADWKGTTPAEVSILVHEMVHHLQNVTGANFACPAERERLAYQAQAEFLALFDLDLYTEFDLDPMTVKLRSSCFF